FYFQMVVLYSCFYTKSLQHIHNAFFTITFFVFQSVQTLNATFSFTTCGKNGCDGKKIRSISQVGFKSMKFVFDNKSFSGFKSKVCTCSAQNIHDLFVCLKRSFTQT